MPFQLCIGDASGWKRLPVEIDVPEMILDIEARMRANEKLSEEQGGQLKKFWRAADAAARTEHGVVGRETTILKPGIHEAPIGSIRTDPQSRIDIELTKPQLAKDDPRSLVRQAQERASWSLQLHPVILLREFVAAWKKRGEIRYPKGSLQLAWQDRHGLIWLRGRVTGWEIATCSKPGIDFSWVQGDPRTPEQIACAREVPAAVSYGEEPATWKHAWADGRRGRGQELAADSPDERPHPEHKWATPKLERLWERYQAALDKLPAHEQERLLGEAADFMRDFRAMDPITQEATLAMGWLSRLCPCESGKPFEECHGMMEKEEDI